MVTTVPPEIAPLDGTMDSMTGASDGWAKAAEAVQNDRNTKSDFFMIASYGARRRSVYTPPDASHRRCLPVTRLCARRGRRSGREGDGHHSALLRLPLA